MDEKENVAVLAAKALIGISAVAHLIFSYVHTQALLVMENEICGFIMFLFILFGLVALFESTQIRPKKKLPVVLTALASFLTSAFGGMLIHLYQDALKNQASVVPAPVNQAVFFSWCLIAAFVAAGVLLLISTLKKEKK